jgi:hypothetical protein
MDEDRRVIEQKLGEYVAAILQGDRGRVVFSIVSESPEKAGDLSRKPCPAPPMRPADSFRPAIVSAYCNNPAVAQDQDRMDIAAVFRGDRFRVVFRKSCRMPGDFSETARHKKSFAVWPLSGRKSPAKRSSRWSKTTQDAPNGGQ